MFWIYKIVFITSAGLGMIIEITSASNKKGGFIAIGGFYSAYRPDTVLVTISPDIPLGPF